MLQTVLSITFSFRQLSDKNDNNVNLTTANQVPASANKGSAVMNGQATTFKGVPGMSSSCFCLDYVWTI